MIERVIIKGNKRDLVDTALDSSQFKLGKVFPVWDVSKDANSGWLVYEFTILYPDERTTCQNIPDALYFSRLIDFENWFNNGID